ncbi:rRNA methylase [Thermus oshimai JL-2]|uniref:rRNA methylase n=1 Tax=Thermus oshimai JL-2 TaxID=751945 RepID=K7REV1_THEOS|nr:TrmH family RNA methyltransferase [Thermus oshimai]AFV75117.1 rRNA methylase [Thermus oshimai JL-2]
MPSVLEIASPKNPRVKALAELKERRGRKEQGLFLVEGLREVERALSAGLRPKVLVLGPQAGPEGKALMGEAEEVLLLSQRALERVSTRENPAQVLAAFPIPQRRLSEVRLPENPLVLAAIGVEKPGNLGAILRSADAAGAHLVLVAGGVDPYSPQVVHNATGVLFHLPVLPVSEEELARFLRERGLKTVAASPRGERLYWEEDYRGGVAFLVGSEDRGLGEAWLEGARARVRIPMRGVADSLNVSVAAALLLYEALRQRGL